MLGILFTYLEGAGYVRYLVYTYLEGAGFVSYFVYIP